MYQIFKRGGPHSKDGLDYSFKAVSPTDIDKYLCGGWVRAFDELHIEDAVYEVVKEEVPEEVEEVEEVPEEGSDYEAELRDKIKALGGKAGGRSSIETLEKKLSELEDAARDN